MEVNDVFNGRRSVNFFDPARKVDEALIKKIYDIARLCPSSFNLQPWKIILVSSPENKKKLREAALGQPKVEEASCVLILLGDKQAYEDMGEIFDDMAIKGYQKKEAKESILGFAKSLYSGDAASRGFALRNIGLFAMSFMLAAKDLGVDTHPMDGFEQEKVKRAFNIPDRYEVGMLMAVGYHNKAKPLLSRLIRKDFDKAFIKEGFRET